MKKKSLILIALIGLIAFCAVEAVSQDKRTRERVVVVSEQPVPVREEQPANGSLFIPDAPGSSLVTDFKARRLGDLIFIDVDETSSASVTSGAKRSRDSGALGGLIGLIAALPTPGATAVSGVVGGLGSRKFEGNGSTQRQSTLQARITARVVEVLPNGDLRIEAEKLVKINKENEKLTLSGVVRTKDVSAQNSVPSSSLGDLKVALNGKGVASADNQPGWLFRLLDKVSPF
jgi:flagellar L-ring protein precursor FlgH